MEARSVTRPPAYSLHKPTGQAYVRVGNQFVYLGRWGSTESHMRYEQTIAQWRASGGLLPKTDIEKTTVAEVVAAFLHRAQCYNYSPDALVKINKAMNGLMLFSDCLAKDFGPLKLRAVREPWERTLTRQYANALTSYCKMAFRHAISMELVTPKVAAALDTLENLKMGRCRSREEEENTPVSWEIVQRTIEKLTPVTRAMLLMMWHTGARGAEVRLMRPMDISREGDVWIYRPIEHKTELYGHDRTIFLGPQAQDILRPWLVRPAERFCFCPQESTRYKELAKQPVESILVPPNGEKPFQRQSFIRAVKRAAVAAGLDAWTPHQIRHSATCRFTEAHGAEVAQRIMGHAKLDMTEHYNKKEIARAIAAARVSG